ncbi:MAG: DUF4422 domain-containing protein [Lachnospiraceae bacterium]|nr:DUF4422 domain-containing protein [Lachnospiraceae bacterium]
MSIHLFTITHKPFTPPGDSLYVPLHVGRANSQDLGYLGDHTGDSISALNSNFCELTGIYWLWKNYQKEDYVGICHYRRYLINEKGSIFTQNELEDLLSRYDILTTRLLTLPVPYREGFSANHHEKDLLALERILKEKYPEYHPVFHELVNSPHTYFGNIFVTSRENFDAYCEWLFTLLFALLKETDFTGYNNYQKRLFGFLSEFLQTVWIRNHQLSVCECMVGMVGEKYETRMLREELASLLEKRDYQGAKGCFLKHYEKRPDVLMEASDVNGELRLCMQIISTCEFEDEAYGRCILDDIRDYPALVEHFGRLNTAVSHQARGYADAQDKAFLRQNALVTPMAKEIALRLFGEPL